ncbi:TetR family transcriptional regulator [Actinomycetospora straminea]|uniref:TetR/AcrR family transcriptional regulator n=1 Tax=Actinomycetospora straminea TaxID=663607 RepID=A0ABP9ELP1_9PSEU|nr:TetR family transcriptional regulator [Actinomycetospora straminea]MDD7933109.1 TetR family transcriptional regulator [Actinomycetospora straminea]
MTVRDKVLEALESLVLEGNPEPTFDEVAARAAVSKGGLLHHFPDRAALTAGLLRRIVERTDRQMDDAARVGRAAVTWLRLSAEDGADQQTARALLSLVRMSASGRVDLPDDVAEAIGRWQRAIAAELADPVEALLVRLVGDGLFLAALTGQAVTGDELEELVARVLPTAARGAPSR